MLYKNGEEFSDWDNEKIKQLFLDMRATYRKNIAKELVGIANSKFYKAHSSDFRWDVLDLVHLEEKIGDARITPRQIYDILENQMDSDFDGEELTIMNVVGEISTLHNLCKFLKDMEWE